MIQIYKTNKTDQDRVRLKEFYYKMFYYSVSLFYLILFLIIDLVKESILSFPLILISKAIECLEGNVSLFAFGYNQILKEDIKKFQ